MAGEGMKPHDDEARLNVAHIPLSPEMQRAMMVAAEAQAKIDDELDALLSPEARKRIEDGDREFTRRVLFGDGA
jgi:hypothetical protein